MATKFYLHQTAPVYTPATIRGAWDQTAGAIARRMEQQKEWGGTIDNHFLFESSATLDFDVLLARFISGPLAAQTISGTIDAVIGLSESSALANLHWHLHIYVTQGDSDTPRGTLLSDYTEPLGTNEWPNLAFATLNAAAALSSLAISAGDRLVIEVGYVSREASATSRYGMMYLGTGTAISAAAADGAAAGTDVSLKAGFFTFSGTITEAVVPVRISQDSLEIAEQAGVTGLRLAQFSLEVVSLSEPAPAGWHHEVIEYTGNGVVDRLIPTSVALDSGAVAVFVYHVPSSGASTASAPVVRTSAFANTYEDGSSTESAAYVKTLVAGGFTVGTASQVNANGDKYVAVVFRDSSPAGDFMKVGVYNGNGADNRTIAVGFQPTHVWVLGRSHAYRSTDFSGDSSITFRNEAAGAGADMIQSFSATGFEVGTDNNVNNASLNYGYVALKASAPLLDQGFASFTATGSAGDDAVSGLGFTPAFVLAKRYEPSVEAYYRSTNSHAGDDSQGWNSVADTAGGGVKSIDADGATFGNVVAPNADAFYGYALSGASAAPPAASLQKVTQLVVEMATDEDADADPPPVTSPCTGGGTVASGTNPAAGTSLATATVIHKWMEITIGATTYRWSDVAINVTTAKEPRVLSWGRVARGLTDGRGGFETASMTIRLADVDRLLRGLHSTSTLLNKVATVYVADDATIRAAGTPWTLFTGVVRDFRPESDLTYRLVLEDALTLSVSSFAQERLVPSYLIGNQISDRNPVEQVWDAPAQICYGSLSDEDEDVPVGTVLAPFIAGETVAGHAELGNMSKFLVCRGASHDVQSVFIGDPFSGDPPTVRAKAAAGEYGTRIFVPHQAGWIDSPAEYYVQDTYRWTYIYVIGAHPGQEQARLKRIPVTVNLCGRETVGDGSGNTIDSLPLQCLHFLNNEVVQAATGNWLAIKALGSYSLFDTASFTTVKTRSEARVAGGYKGAFVLGFDFKQITLRAAIAQFCQSGDFDLGVNRFGQIFATMLDRTSTASSATVFTDEHDILKDSFRIDPKADEVENKIRYVYKRNYIPALQDLNPDSGTRLPREPFDAGWLSGLQSVSDATSISNIGETRESQLIELEMVREALTADDVAAQRLALRRNPRAEAVFDLTIPRGAPIELGDVVKVTHFQGLGASGWTARRLQVRRIEVDLDRLTVTLTCRDVHDLLA